MGANAQIAVPVFTAGQVLTATQQTQINTGIPVFATTVTRDAAFGGAGEKTLAEGQFAYIEATDTTQYYDGAAWQSVGAAAQTIAIFNETQASGTQGGTSVAATFTKRTLNTTVINNIGATLTASVIALTAGTYEVFAMSPHLVPNSMVIRLRNTTDGTTTVAGVNNYTAASGNGGGYAQLDGVFTITATKNFEVQYYVSNAQAGNGLGVAVGAAGVSEIYTQITIRKVG